MESNFLVTAQHITKNYGKLKVLDDITLKLQAGKITCVLGSSGCGKTTLLKILGGLETPTNGTISSNFSLPGKSVGYMSQENSLLPWKTAEQNVLFAMELVGAKKNHRQAMKMLRKVRLSRFFRYYPVELSGGQKQRVALARMLAVSPTLLLLDEPFSALDMVVKNDLAQIIRNYVKETQAAAFMITHSIEEALIIADTVLILTSRPARIADKIEITDKERNNIFSKIKLSLEKTILEKK